MPNDTQNFNICNNIENRPEVTYFYISHITYIYNISECKLHEYMQCNSHPHRLKYTVTFLILIYTVPKNNLNPENNQHVVCASW